jgi:dTDP-4-amino-4,6-dideoxygalactose transaminase
MDQKVPFLDLITLHLEMEEEFVAVFRDAVRTGRFIGGPEVEGFEREFAAFCEAKYCVGVGSGTDALRFALIAAGIKQGDMVLTVPNTFIATTEAVSQAGAQAEFIDIDERTYNIDPEKLGDFLSKECKKDAHSGRTIHSRSRRPVTAVIPVHLYGQVADMDRIAELAEAYDLVVIEDACQAHGAGYLSKRENRWKKAGILGGAAAFSFYPGKNLGACGEAGAVTTNDGRMVETIRMLRDHGQCKKYYHDIEGYNGRLDAIQAAILRIKLRRLAAWNEERTAIARRYNELLRPVPGVIIPYEPEWSRAVYHLYVIHVQKRDALQAFLSQRGITTGLHYPVPLHQQKAYASSNLSNSSLPVSERAAREILSLPMFPGLTEQQQKQVVEGIREFMKTQDRP